MFSQYSRDFTEKCSTSVTGCCVYWRNEVQLATFKPLIDPLTTVTGVTHFEISFLRASSAPINIENLEKWMIFMGSATPAADVETRTMEISVTLHLVQGKGDN
jgi:hypothetical protein